MGKQSTNRVDNKPILDQGCRMVADKLVPCYNISVLLCITHMVRRYQHVVRSVQKCPHVVRVVWTTVGMVLLEDTIVCVMATSQRDDVAITLARNIAITAL
ncbi:hypothetical protein NHX12_002397 [Muraenolepis orangiensis]|uniref:Uncharacterized protein n=1 Tax=Muraenolepis orangiensis TaxID=630683 RepID=A0A9Q0DX59_9TELE|nr:hypothetical protein NHX12_002397 [Muraenolepis orangiensis]